jgi:hypothetical protein
MLGHDVIPGHVEFPIAWPSITDISFADVHEATVFGKPQHVFPPAGKRFNNSLPSSAVINSLHSLQLSSTVSHQSSAVSSFPQQYSRGGRPGVWEEGQTHISVARRAPRSSVLSGPGKPKRMCTHILGDFRCEANDGGRLRQFKGKYVL